MPTRETTIEELRLDADALLKVLSGLYESWPEFARSVSNSYAVFYTLVVPWAHKTDDGTWIVMLTFFGSDRHWTWEREEFATFEEAEEQGVNTWRYVGRWTHDQPADHAPYIYIHWDVPHWATYSLLCGDEPLMFEERDALLDRPDPLDRILRGVELAEAA